jgi:hypothetical protein
MSGPGHVTGNRVREDERRPGFPFGGFALNDYCHPPVITAVSLLPPRTTTPPSRVFSSVGSQWGTD